MKPLRVVFMGTPEFAVPSLAQIFQSPHKIVAVVSQPDRPRGRGLKVYPPAVKQFALRHSLGPILQPQSLKDEQFISELRACAADVFVVVAFHILPEVVFSMPPRGTVNLHPSLLPAYRGAAPINWAVINGEEKTGVTTIFIQKEIDAGNIIEQEEAPIYPDDSAGTLHDRLAEQGARLLLSTLNRIAAGDLRTRRQDESLASPAPKINRQMCHLRLTQPAANVHNWIRGLSPFPGAYVLRAGEMLKIYRSRLISTADSGAPAGTVLQAGAGGIQLSCSPGIIAVTDLQLPGRKRLDVAEFLRGTAISVGEVWE